MLGCERSTFFYPDGPKECARQAVFLLGRRRRPGQGHIVQECGESFQFLRSVWTTSETAQFLLDLIAPNKVGLATDVAPGVEWT